MWEQDVHPTCCTICQLLTQKALVFKINVRNVSTIFWGEWVGGDGNINTLGELLTLMAVMRVVCGKGESSMYKHMTWLKSIFFFHCWIIGKFSSPECFPVSPTFIFIFYGTVRMGRRVAVDWAVLTAQCHSWKLRVAHNVWKLLLLWVFLETKKMRWVGLLPS